MIEKNNSYSEYKDSGVEWIGKIPSHWKILKNSMLFKEIVDTGNSDMELLSILINKGIVKQSSTGRKNRMSEDNHAYKKIKKNDIGYNLMNAFMGGIGASKYDGIISPAYAVCRAKIDLNPWYFDYLFRTPLYKSEFNKNSYGIMYERNRLYFDRFKGTYSYFPPKEEQDQIVRYLDYKLAKIAKFIKAKKKLIAVLKEQKQAVINEAVTKGINPNVKMKPSGIEWLGDVPEGWDIVRCKYLFKEINIRSIDGNETHLSMSQKYGLVPNEMLDEHRLLSENYTGGKVCEKDDLVLNRLKAHLGVFALAPQQGVISPDYTVLRTNNMILPLFAETILKSQKCRSELILRVKGIVEGFWRLYTDDFYNIVLPVPDYNEQLMIMKFINQKFEIIDSSITKIESEVQLINEYRTSLVSDVVTGKVDVRGIEIEDVMEPVEEIEEIDEDILPVDGEEE